MAIKKLKNSNTQVTNPSNSQTPIPFNILGNGDVANRQGGRRRQCGIDGGKDDDLGVRATMGEGNDVVATVEPGDAHRRGQ